MTDAFPLAWPDGWPRTPAHERQVGKYRFGRNDSRGGRRLWTVAEARDALLDELGRFKATHVVVSSDFPLNARGQLAGNARKPDDQGIALYFRREGRSYVMAHDAWAEAESNLRSLALSIEALRQLERHGGGKMLERAFQGFAALPAPKRPHEVLGIAAGATAEEIKAAHRRLISRAHPDQGGSEAAASEINAARDAMLKGVKRG